MSPFNFGWVPLIQQELRRYFATAEQGALADTALQPLPTLRRFGGVSTADFSSTGSFAFSANDGTLHYRNFTLNAGHTMTVDKFARIVCSGNVTIAGNIVVTPLAPGGKGNPYFDISGASAFFGGYAEGQGLGQARNTYSWQAQPYGSGGMGGYGRSFTSAGGLIRAGGAGGGGLIIEAGGTITITGSASANGGSASNASISSGNGIVAGAGGGSGGLILLGAAVGVVVSGTLSVTGGNGGNGANTGISGVAQGGEPGGGGRVVLMAPSINTTGSTINLAAGTAGAAAGTGAVALGGAAGGSFGGAGGGYGLAATVGLLRTITIRPVE